VLSNAQLAELLYLGAEAEPREHRRKALERAGRSAYFTWAEEAADVAAGSGRSLTELPSVGPWIARILLGLLQDEDLEPPEPPPLRRGFLTLAEARATLVEQPEWRTAIRADLQMHTTYSDGRAELRDMVGAAGALGYQYVAITDHSKGLKIANGMDEARLADEAADVAAVNEELEASGVPMRVLHAIEMNLSPQGEGDMDPAALARLDLVLGAFHSKLRVTEDQTERYLRALRNPDVHVIAHPRGRRFGVRLGLQADWDRVAAAAAESGTALEIDAYPDRQDLDVGLLELVRDAGGTVSIGTDAHSVAELRFLEFGLAAAVRAGLPRERILNFRPVEEVTAWATELRAGRRG
jgi:histidinol phosphatase-like PHP family hydrolase